VVLQTLLFNNKQIYLLLWSVPEQKLHVLTPYMAAFFDKICPYKINDRKIFKIEHIDSSRCLKPKREPKTSFLINFFDDRINTLQTKCVYTFYIRRKNLEKLLSNNFFAFLPALPSIDLSIYQSICHQQMMF
jgi:hypothetical protein